MEREHVKIIEAHMIELPIRTTEISTRWVLLKVDEKHSGFHFVSRRGWIAFDENFAAEEIGILPRDHSHQDMNSLNLWLDNYVVNKSFDIIPYLKKEIQNETENKGTTKEDRAAHAFIKWCRESGGLLNRFNAFKNFIEKETKLSAEVIYRENDSLDSFYFVNQARDPVEYWLVNGNMLFPKPLSDERFKELDPVFEGEARPKSIRTIKPAILSGKTLTRRGEIS